MTKSELVQKYRPLSAEDQREFDRWLKVNAVIGSVFVAAFLAMGLAGTNATGPRQAVAQGETAKLSTSARTSDVSQVSPYDLTIRIGPDQLPVQQVNEPF